MKTKLFAGCAAYRSIMPATVASMIRLASVEHETFDLVDYSVAHGYGTLVNLDSIYESFLASDAELLLYHDADMVWNPDDVDAMVALHEDAGIGSAVIAAFYPSSFDAQTLVGQPVDGARRLRCTHPRLGLLLAVPASRIGFGLVLIPRGVLEGLARPRAVETWDGNHFMTQDTVFSRRVRDIGAHLFLTGAAGSVRHHVTRRLAVGETF